MKKNIFGMFLVISLVLGLACAQKEITSVTELERLAPLGGEYRLAAGRYVLTEPILLTKGLTLIGAGKDSTSVLGSSQYYLFSIESSDKFKFEGINFEYIGVAGSDVVDIKDADFEIIDCTFSGGLYSEENDLFYGSGLYLHGDAKGTIVDSYFAYNQQDAIHLERNATATISKSLIENNVGAISIFENTSFTVIDSQIIDNGNEDSFAIYAEGDSKLVIKESTIEKNSFGAIWIIGAAKLLLEDNVISFSGSEYSAVTAEKNAALQIINNDFSDNMAGAIWIKENASSTINQNRFTGNGTEELSAVTVEGEGEAVLNENVFNADWGLWFAENSKVTANNNTIIGSLSERFAAITITDSARVDLNKNVISEGNNWAVFATDDSQVVLLQNTMNSNYEGGFINASTGAARLIANKVADNNGYGSYLIRGSKTYVAANRFERNSSGLVISENATADVFENNFNDNLRSGLGFLGESSGKAVSNRMSGNAWNGIVVGDSASAVLEHNQIINNILRGILISENAFGKAVDNTIKGSKVGIFTTPEASVKRTNNSFENNKMDSFEGPLPEDEN